MEIVLKKTEIKENRNCNINVKIILYFECYSDIYTLNKMST